MDIHKPKAWHGWREFLKEYLIIVIGVLTALGAQQVVERLHNRSEADETREALHAEIADNAMYAKVTIAENVCADALGAKIIAWLNGGAKPALTQRAMFLPLRSTVWDTARAKGVALMPMDEQLRLAGYYSNIALYSENEAARRQEALRAFSILMVDRITPEQAARLAESSNGSALLRGYQTGNARAAIAFAAALKIAPAPVGPQMRSQLERYCRAAGVPLPPL